MHLVARKKRGANRRTKKPQRVLADHQQHKRKLVPPMMQLPIKEVSWHQEMLPKTSSGSP